MSDFWRERRFLPAAVGAFAALLAAAAMVPSLRAAGWSVTALPQVGARTGMGRAARRIEPGFRLVRDAYDGQFYWGIAVDPIATGDVHQAFDAPSYRYGHPLYGWLGWLMSAGHARTAAAALVAVSLLSMLGAGAAAASLGPAWGLFVALNPGLLYAAAHDLAEPLAAALLLGGLLAYRRGRLRVALVAFAMLPLAKEELVLVPLALAAWALWRHRDVREAVLLVATVLPAAAWWIYARITLGAWFTTGGNALGVPFAGWKQALLGAGADSYSLDPARSMLGASTVVVLVALLAFLIVATLTALRLSTPVHLLFLPLALIAACLAPRATTLLRDALRNTSLLLVLVPLVLAEPWSTDRLPSSP
jgi:hypothetical protein